VPEWLVREVEDYFVVPLMASPKVIVDIGANIGAFALRARKAWPDAKIIAYEPLPSNVAHLRANLDPDWSEVVPCAVKAEGGQQDMFLGDLFVTGGFERAGRQTLNRIAVDCVAARDLPSCDLLKIDTEGSEVEILRGADLTGVQAILVEHHSREDAETIKAMLGAFDCLHEEPDKEVGTLVFERRATAARPGGKKAAGSAGRKSEGAGLKQVSRAISEAAPARTRKAAAGSVQQQAEPS
jgi:FkbM family methyltransferase